MTGAIGFGETYMMNEIHALLNLMDRIEDEFSISGLDSYDIVSDMADMVGPCGLDSKDVRYPVQLQIIETQVRAYLTRLKNSCITEIKGDWT